MKTVGKFMGGFEKTAATKLPRSFLEAHKKLQGKSKGFSRVGVHRMLKRRGMK